MQASKRDGKARLSLRMHVRHIIRKEGVPGFYRGYLSTIFREVRGLFECGSKHVDGKAIGPLRVHPVSHLRVLEGT